MDPSAVITQVAPPGAGQQQVGAPHGAVVVASAGGGDNNGSNNNENDASSAAAHLANSSQKGTKKRPRRNFLSTLICCLGKKNSSSSTRRRKERRNSGKGGGAATAGPPADLAVSPLAGGAGTALGGGVLSPAGKGKHLLPELRPDDAEKKCIVIDLDETLVHSSFKPINNADFIVPVEIDGTIHQVYVLKRPHVDEFLCKMGELYECILFTASLAKYADPVTDLLDKWDVFRARLFREHCVFHRGNYVKDLSRLGRELSKIIIVDNSPASYIFHPDNAVPVSSWFDDMNDRELLDLIPFLENLAAADGVYSMLQAKFKGGVGSIGGVGSNSLASNGGSDKTS